MSSRRALDVGTIDGLLKNLLVLSRTVDHVVETRAVQAVVDVRLSSSKVQLLRLLGNRGGQTSSQVARFLGISRPAVSQIIDSMVHTRFVVRRSTVRDRREVLLELTKQGKLAFQAIRRKQRQLIRNAARLSETGKADQWIVTLQEIAAALAQTENAFEDFCAQCGGHEDGSCILNDGETECLFLQHSGPAPSCATDKTMKTTKTNKKAKKAKKTRRTGRSK